MLELVSTVVDEVEEVTAAPVLLEVVNPEVLLDDVELRVAVFELLPVVAVLTDEAELLRIIDVAAVERTVDEFEVVEDALMRLRDDDEVLADEGVLDVLALSKVLSEEVEMIEFDRLDVVLWADVD